MTPTTEQLKELVARLRAFESCGIVDAGEAADALQAWIKEREKAEPVGIMRKVEVPSHSMNRQFAIEAEIYDDLPEGTLLYTAPPYIESLRADVDHVLLPIEPTEELIDATRSMFMGLELGCNRIESMRPHLRMIGEDMAMFPDWLKTETGHLTKAGRGILAYALIVAAARKGGA